MLDSHYGVNDADFSQSIFIFLSNTGADLINEHYRDLFLEGRKREDLTISDFENLIQKGAFNEEGWLNKGSGYLNCNIRNIYYN